ncbi:hypothetical protein [Candidatus Similichlamydia epinepheli]|uniref:hypothetical protein n=1 Tax=Candidatus Similichlamydia epinepheli TaxID=1903953 RepID=UPI000D3C3DDD|nr:hypothetical protein [Candidatus Similichlamydia epinepheli]
MATLSSSDATNEFLSKEFLPSDLPITSPDVDFPIGQNEEATIEALFRSGQLSFDPIQKTYFFVIREADPTEIAPLRPIQIGVKEERAKIYKDTIVSTLEPIQLLSIKPSPPPSTSFHTENVLYSELPSPSSHEPNAYLTTSDLGQLLSILRHLMEIRKRMLSEENEFLNKVSEQIIDSSQARLDAIDTKIDGEIALAQARYTAAIVAIVGYSLSLAAIGIGALGALLDRKPSQKKISEVRKKRQIKTDKQQKKSEDDELQIELDREDKELDKDELSIELTRTRDGQLEVDLEREERTKEKKGISPSDEKILQERNESFAKRNAFWKALLDPSVMPIFIQAVGEASNAVRDGMSVDATIQQGKGEAQEIITETWQKFAFKELDSLEAEQKEQGEEISSLISIARRLSQISSQIHRQIFRA